MSNPRSHRTLDAITNQVDGLKAISKAALRFGDQVLVKTLNSTYSIQVLKDGLYSISGGWFDKEGLSPLQTTINGCTFGGSAIKVFASVALSCKNKIHPLAFGITGRTSLVWLGLAGVGLSRLQFWLQCRGFPGL